MYSDEFHSMRMLRRYGHSKLSKMTGPRHLEFVRTVNIAVRSAVPENPTLEPNMKWIGSPVAEIWQFSYIGAYGTPILGGRGGRRGSAMTPLERSMVVSYRLSIVTVALSVTAISAAIYLFLFIYLFIYKLRTQCHTIIAETVQNSNRHWRRPTQVLKHLRVAL